MEQRVERLQALLRRHPEGLSSDESSSSDNSDSESQPPQVLPPWFVKALSQYFTTLEVNCRERLEESQLGELEKLIEMVGVRADGLRLAAELEKAKPAKAVISNTEKFGAGLNEKQVKASLGASETPEQTMEEVLTELVLTDTSEHYHCPFCDRITNDVAMHCTEDIPEHPQKCLEHSCTLCHCCDAATAGPPTSTPGSPGEADKAAPQQSSEWPEGSPAFPIKTPFNLWRHFQLVHGPRAKSLPATQQPGARNPPDVHAQVSQVFAESPAPTTETSATDAQAAAEKVAEEEKAEKAAFLKWLRAQDYALVHPSGESVREQVRAFTAKFLQREKRDQLEGMDEGKVAAVYLYTLETEVYRKVNDVLRGKKPDELKQWRNFILHLNRGLAGLPPVITFPLGSPLYRGINVAVDSALYREGYFVVWPAFSSTTMDPEVAQQFFKGADGKTDGTMFMIIPLSDGQSRGHEISAMSALPKEKEVLFEFNTYFKVNRKLGPAMKKFFQQKLGYSLDRVEVYELAEVPEEIASAETAKLQANNGVALLGQIKKGDVVEVAKLLDKPVNLDTTDGVDGKTPVICAIEKGLTEVAIKIVELKASPDLADKDGKTPLMHAIQRNYADVSLQLIQCKVDINAKDKDNKTPLMYSADKLGEGEAASAICTRVF
eukprot:RCo016120